MSNIFIINSAKAFGHSGGELNKLLTKVAKEALENMGHSVKVTNVDVEYDIDSEVDRYLWADTVIYQMPAWWMEAPWIMKRYVDEVFTAGYGKLYVSDGRSSAHPTKGYGSGGLLQGKQYMFSFTWNAPIEAFTEQGQCFEQRKYNGSEIILSDFYAE